MFECTSLGVVRGDYTVGRVDAGVPWVPRRWRILLSRPGQCWSQLRRWICCRAGDRECQKAGAMSLGMTHGAWRDWLGIQPACPKGVNETRDKLRIVRTIMPSSKRREGEREKLYAALPSTGGRHGNDTSSSWENALPSSRTSHCDQSES
jgi:hypothetical protein